MIPTFLFTLYLHVLLQNTVDILKKNHQFVQSHCQLGALAFTAYIKTVSQRKKKFTNKKLIYILPDIYKENDVISRI